MSEFSGCSDWHVSSMHPLPNTSNKAQKPSKHARDMSTEHTSMQSGMGWERYHVESDAELFPQKSTIGD
jgi:hypothetical protein